MIKYRTFERGASMPVILTIVSLSVLSVGALAMSVWAYINYEDQRSNVQAKVDAAVAIAEKEQADRLEEKFQQREKEPNQSFTGPSDFGSLGFKYPKTWSVFIENDGRDDSDFSAYLNPVRVPPVSEEQRFALRVTITQTPYEEVLEEYSGQVEEGALRTSTIRANGANGTRVDGNFTEDIRGSAVVFKIRDKTAIIRTDADTFKPDFERLIKTISFKE